MDVLILPHRDLFNGWIYSGDQGDARALVNSRALVIDKMLSTAKI